VTVLLALCYTALAALLLNLNVATAWSWRVKAGSIALVSVFYGATWFGLQALEGWPTAQPLPERFRLQWIAIDEPDKRSGSDGAIYFWVRLDGDEVAGDEPRAHVVPYDGETADDAREALAMLQGGRRVEGRLTKGLIDTSVEESDAPDIGEEAAGSGGLDDRPRFEFREVPPPDLPAKPPLGVESSPGERDGQ
jgi:hypothetical protein